MNKTSLLLVFNIVVLVLAPQARADVLSNTTFNGSAYWHGDGRPVQPTNEQEAAHVSGGLVVKLKPDTWTSISQNFSGRNRSFDYTITYQPAPGSSLSPPPPHGWGRTVLRALQQITQAGLAEDPKDIRPGNLIVGILDSTEGRFYYNPFKLPIGSTKPQTLTGTLSLSSDGSQERTFFIVFPPGAGTISFQLAALAPSSAPGTDPSPMIRFYGPDVTNPKK